jgi:hypothetical protein
MALKTDIRSINSTMQALSSSVKGVTNAEFPQVLLLREKHVHGYAPSPLYSYIHEKVTKVCEETELISLGEISLLISRTTALAYIEIQHAQILHRH